MLSRFLKVLNSITTQKPSLLPSMKAALFIALCFCSSARSAMVTFPADLEFYKVHTPFEHIQYSLPKNADVLVDEMESYFLSRNWVRTHSNQSSDTKTTYSKEAYSLISDMHAERLPAIRAHDLKKDNRIVKKWKRTQRWEDWSEVPQPKTIYTKGYKSNCFWYNSPAIQASTQGATNSFKDQLKICLQTLGGNNTTLTVVPYTLHFIDGRYQIGVGQVGISWLDWLDGVRSASEVASFKEAVSATKQKKIGGSVIESGPAVRSGTGFFINSRAIATNQHVIDGCTQVNVVGKDMATVVAQDEANDLAILFSSSSNTDYLQIAQGNVALGDDILVYGYPLQSVLSPTIHLTKGSVSSLAGLQGNSSYFQMTAPIQPGNSGGPVVNENGLVVGVTTSTLSPRFAMSKLGTIPQGVNFAVRATLLANLMEIYGIAAGASRQSEGYADAEFIEGSVVSLWCEEQ
jgi:S1-C subfamily serine protease